MNLRPALGVLLDKTYHLPVCVYYEDTDQQGIVFYTHYLNYLERDRTELLRALGAPPAQIETERNRRFVAVRVNMRYH